MNGQLLRDLKRNTEMLILVEMLKSPSVRMKEIAERLDITIQAVSQYISAMKSQGLLKERSGNLIPTRKGMQIAQEHFTSLKDFVDATLRTIAVIERTVAIAGCSIRKNQAVGLVMEDGMLMAYPGQKASSTGKALESAEEGDDVVVGQLEGIVDLELGRLLIVETPSELEGGSKSVDIARMKDRIDLFSPGLLVAGDPIGSALLMKTSGEFFTIHAPVASAMSAVSKGVDVVFSGTHESVDQLLQAVSSLRKESGYEIRCKTIRA
jgi:predicted transcriptional regulator